MWATPASVDLSMAFANRSAAHFDNGNFLASIQDIDNAFNVGSYPEKLAYKLHLRRAISQKQLGEEKLALGAFSTAEDLLSVAQLDAVKLAEVREIIEESKSELSQPAVLQSDLPAFKESLALPSVESGSESVPELSDSLRLTHQARVGRHVVAERDISVGDILGVEEATVWRLLPSPQLRRICCHCMRESHNPLPCSKCAAVR